jgi:hypothetical protein
MLCSISCDLSKTLASCIVLSFLSSIHAFLIPNGFCESSFALNVKGFELGRGVSKTLIIERRKRNHLPLTIEFSLCPHRNLPATPRQPPFEIPWSRSIRPFHPTSRRPPSFSLRSATTGGAPSPDLPPPRLRVSPPPGPWLVGPIDGAACDAETVDRANAHLREPLRRLAAAPFFRRFAVSLEADCRFWGRPAGPDAAHAAAAEAHAAPPPDEAQAAAAAADPESPEFWGDLCRHIPPNSSRPAMASAAATAPPPRELGSSAHARAHPYWRKPHTPPA